MMVKLNTYLTRDYYDRDKVTGLKQFRPISRATCSPAAKTRRNNPDLGSQSKLSWNNVLYRQITPQTSSPPEIAEVTGETPHMIVSQLHRSKMDPNREREEAAQGDFQAEYAFDTYHG